MDGTERLRSVASFPLGSARSAGEPQEPLQGPHGSTRYETPHSATERADRTSGAPQVNEAFGALCTAI